MTVGGSLPTSGQIEAPPAEVDPGSESQRLAAVEAHNRNLRSVLSLLGIYVLVRALLLGVDALSASNGRHFFGSLSSWDGDWYLRIAARGYPPAAATAMGHLTYGAAGFEPVFPALIRATESFGFTAVEAALAVSFVAGAISVLLVWRLGCVVCDQRVGWIAAVLFCVFPGLAVPWGLLYSECVGLALAAGCLLLMVRQRWLWAGLVGAIATATSPMALPLVLAAGVPAVQAMRRRELPRALVTFCLIPMGFVAYVGYLALRYHDPLFWWHLQHQAWGARIDFGRSLVALLAHPESGGYQGRGWMEWVGAVSVVVLVVATIRARLPTVINVYCAGTFILMFVSNELGFKPRFLAWAFPSLIALAAITRRRGWQAVAIGFAVVLPIVLLGYTAFGNYVIQP